MIEVSRDFLGFADCGHPLLVHAQFEIHLHEGQALEGDVVDHEHHACIRERDPARVQGVVHLAYPVHPYPLAAEADFNLIRVGDVRRKNKAHGAAHEFGAVDCAVLVRVQSGEQISTQIVCLGAGDEAVRVRIQCRQG